MYLQSGSKPSDLHMYTYLGSVEPLSAPQDTYLLAPLAIRLRQRFDNGFASALAGNLARKERLCPNPDCLDHILSSVLGLMGCREIIPFIPLLSCSPNRLSVSRHPLTSSSHSS